MPSLIKVSVYAKPSDRILISELIMPRKGILSSSNTCILSLYIRTKNHPKIQYQKGGCASCCSTMVALAWYEKCGTSQHSDSFPASQE